MVTNIGRLSNGNYELFPVLNEHSKGVEADEHNCNNPILGNMVRDDGNNSDFGNVRHVEYDLQRYKHELFWLNNQTKILQKQFQVDDLLRIEL